MSIYPIEQILGETKKKDKDGLVRVIQKILLLPMSKSLRSKYARIIMGDTSEDVADRMPVMLSESRSIPRQALKTLIKGGMLTYTREIIMAALDPRGPFQSTEILMLAAQIYGQPTTFVTVKGIPQRAKNEAGYILSMAGFERLSHYDREKRTPVKAWLPAKGMEKVSLEDRIAFVESFCRQETKTPALTIKPKPLMENFI